MIYDVPNMPPARRRAVGLVPPGEMPAPSTGSRAISYNLMPLLNTAAPIFRRHDNTMSGTKLKIHRVERLNPGDEATIQLMREQGQAREVDAFLTEQPVGGKLILWGTFIPADGPAVTRENTFAEDLVIAPGVGLSRDQFTEWYFSANYCKQATCALKLLLDELMARGDQIILEQGWFPGLSTDCVLTQVERAEMPAGLPLQAFFLVDPARQPEHAHVHNDAAFPLYHQGIDTEQYIPHDVLALTGRPRSGDGPDVRVHVDPTYRQVMPGVDLPTELKCYPMGSFGVDPNYCVHGTRARVLRDEEPFKADNMDLVMHRMFPDNQFFTDEEDRRGTLQQTYVSTLTALTEVMSLRPGR